MDIRWIRSATLAVLSERAGRREQPRIPQGHHGRVGRGGTDAPVQLREPGRQRPRGPYARSAGGPGAGGVGAEEALGEGGGEADVVAPGGDGDQVDVAVELRLAQIRLGVFATPTLPSAGPIRTRVPALVGDVWEPQLEA